MGPRALERDGRVATLALAAVLPEMHVVLCMAVGARRIQLHLISGLFVTISAIELCVRACEREVRLLAVVELPDTPPVCGMAATALISHAAMMEVVCTMAIDARAAGVLVCAGDMALFAGHRDVQTDEGKAREVVVESRVCAPPRRRVALSAIDSELAGVHVPRAVAADAVRAQLLGGDHRRVTCVTGHLLVPAFERPMGVASVIERSGQPFLAAVAGIAFLTETTGVRVFALVTAVTVAR